MIQRISIFILMLSIYCSCKHYLPGYNYKLFKDTPIYSLAKAVESDNLSEMIRLVKEEKMNVNYREPKFGNNILMLAIVNQTKETVQTLLNLGADPNLRNSYSNDTSLTVAIKYMDNCNLNKVKLLVEHGADVNTRKKYSREATYESYNETALSLASSKKKCIDLVKYLVDKGAHVNDTLYYKGYGAITSALIHNNLDVVLYLIKQPSTKIPDIVYIRDEGGKNERKLSITDMLEKKKL
jgi:ankyrin repeat protein